MIKQENGMLRIVGDLNGKEVLLFESKVIPKGLRRIDEHTTVNPWFSPREGLPAINLPGDDSDDVLIEVHDGNFYVAQLYAWRDINHQTHMENCMTEFKLPPDKRVWSLSFEPTFEISLNEEDHILLDEVVRWQYIMREE